MDELSAAGSRLKTQMRQAEDEIARLRLEARQHEAAAQRNGNDAAKAMSQLGLLETKLAAADAEVVRAKKASLDAKRIAEAEALERVRCVAVCGGVASAANSLRRASMDRCCRRSNQWFDCVWWHPL